MDAFLTFATATSETRLLPHPNPIAPAPQRLDCARSAGRVDLVPHGIDAHAQRLAISDSTEHLELEFSNRDDVRRAAPPERNPRSPSETRPTPACDSHSEAHRCRSTPGRLLRPQRQTSVNTPVRCVSNLLSCPRQSAPLHPLSPLPLRLNPPSSHSTLYPSQDAPPPRHHL
jgi:hypothetical protein